MNKAEFLQDLQQKISDLMRQSPAAEIEKTWLEPVFPAITFVGSAILDA